MQNILMFLFGIVVVMLFLPIIQGIADMVQACSQWFISTINVKITSNNIAIENLKDSTTKENTQVIGFQTSDEYETYDEDDDDRDNKSKNKNKIGF